jgi:Domain of unknown function (DUF4333)
MGRRAAALLALAGACLLGACGERTLDERELESSLKRQLDGSAGVTSRGVDCPADVPAEKDRKFACTLIAPNWDEVRVDVRLTNDEGGFSANVSGEERR